MCSLSVGVGRTRYFRYVQSSDLHLPLKVIYPTLVIVLVETQRSMSDICEISPSNASKIPGLMASDTRAATLGHLSFAAGTVHSTTDNELESQRSWIPDGQLEEHGFKVVLELKERV